MGFGLEKPDPSSLGKKTTKVITRSKNPVKDAQQKKLRERHEKFVADVESP